MALPTDPPNFINNFKSLQDKQLEMWKQWKDSNENPNYLRPLQASFAGLIGSYVNKYRNLEAIPKPMLQAKAEELFIQALRSYKPGLSGLSTHISTRLQQIDRYVKTYQNAGRIQETRAGQFGQYLASKTQLMDTLGRDPTAEELSNHMTLAIGKNISSREAQRFIKEDRKDIGESGWGDDSLAKIPSVGPMVLRMAYGQLTPEQKAVYERLYGLNGSRMMKPSEIAADLRIHITKVSRIRGQIEAILKPYLPQMYSV
jgi:hypothetical protein